MLPKDRYHAAIEGLPRDRVPVTPIFMAWAAHLVGRTYRDYYLDASVLVESQHAAAERLHTDQVSVISDPWVEASAYGMTFDWPEEGVGVPRGHLLHEPADVSKLRAFDIDAAPRLRNRVEAAAGLARACGGTHSVLGWVEGPIAEYVDLRGMEDALLDLIEQPAMYEEAAAMLVANALAFARAQIEAGADVIGVGDAAASVIGPELYAEHVQPWQTRLFEGIHAAGAKVKLHICGNINAILPMVAQTGADVIDCDHMVPLERSRQVVGDDVALCGNFDPAGVLAAGTPERVADAARQNLDAAGDRYILQPGCEVPPGTPIESIEAFCPGPNSLISDALRRG